MSVLNVKTKDQILFIEKPVPIITSGNQNNDVIRVTFDETWDCENGKFFASFYIEKPEEAIPCDLTLEEGNCFRCTIPEAMLKKEGYFHFGVWCDSQDKRKTSDVKMVRVNQGAVVTKNSGNNGGGDSSNGETGCDCPDIDHSNYVTKDMMPEIKFEDIFEPFVETKDPYKIETDPIYWKDNTTIDRTDGTFKNSEYPTCVTPEMYVVSGEFYKVEGNCYETDVYQYDFDGNFVECSSVTSDGLFKVCENTATIRFVVPKFNDTGEEIDLNATIERFAKKFKLYYCDKYKLKDRVKLPDNIVIPTRTSELENDNEFITQYDVLSDKVEAELTTTIIEPNKYYSFGEVAELTIEFAEGVAEKVNEYMFGFVSGETATVLTLPSSVKWANEITVEPNKRYEISIVDNIALWCAVDLAVSE